MIPGAEAAPDLFDQLYEHVHSLHSLEELLGALTPVEWWLIHTVKRHWHRVKHGSDH